MLQTTWIALMLGFWSSLYLLDAFLKSKKSSSRQYLHFLDKTGLSVSVCQLRWYSPVFNRCFMRIGQWRPSFLRLWFTIGVFVALVTMLLSVFLLGLLVFNTLRQEPVEQQVLTPVMPGVNLPVSQIWYYMLTLLICGILHEVGHAIAAVREQVRVNGFGVFLLLMYPGAFVDLSSEHLQAVSPLRQLRIYCAGVWHNFVIVIVAIMLLLALPMLLMPFYTTGKAAAITGVAENSAVAGPRGLVVGEALTGVGDCRVNGVSDWHDCILTSMKEPSLGHCLPVSLITHLSTTPTNRSQPSGGDIDCCNQTSPTHLCFLYHTRTSHSTHYACLPARTTTDRPVCKLQSDCYLPGVDVACVYPAVDNQTKLLRIFHGRRPPLLFLGHPLDLYYSALEATVPLTQAPVMILPGLNLSGFLVYSCKMMSGDVQITRVSVSNYVPNGSLVPLNLPYVVETFCKYLVSLSGALVILNVVPCYALDGQYILHAFIELTLRSSVPDPQIRGIVFSLIILLGTILLGLNVIFAMWTLFS